MGKPFATELDALPHTYAWALTEPIENLANAVRALAGLPLLAVGSGGSFTAAQLACELHRAHTGYLAQALTPLQAVASPIRLRDLAILLPTAGGKNPDVLGSFRRLVAREPRRLLVWCANPGSRLSSLAAKYDFVEMQEFALPPGKDGFLAVNSLLAFAVLLSRAYGNVSGGGSPLPPSFEALVGTESSEGLERRWQHLWDRQTLVVLHGPATLPAAIDIESKFTEAALGSVQVADFRHFAHGRHHWIAKRRADTAVLALTSEDDRHIADPLLALLPADVPVTRIDVPFTGWLAGLAAMVRSFFLVGSAGRVRGIDPGKPGVPPFGRKIYRLDAYRERQSPGDVPPDEAVAIERKAGTGLAGLSALGRLPCWRAGYQEARRLLAETAYCGLVVDYDGTLCDERERYGPLPAEIARHLSRLLRGGTMLGVATGRGKSVREALQKALPARLWKQVVVGYYNGADVGSLADNTCPDGTDAVLPELQSLADRLRADPLFSSGYSITCRRRQISLAPVGGILPSCLWDLVQAQLLSLSPTSGAVALRSGHSVDLIARGVSKLAVVEKVRQLAGGADVEPVLCMGDRGRWPGNDFALLASPHALSVDEVSPDPGAAWNLAPPGHRGRQAALGYLRRLRTARGGILRLLWDRAGKKQQ